MVAGAPVPAIVVSIGRELDLAEGHGGAGIGVAMATGADAGIDPKQGIVVFGGLRGGGDGPVVGSVVDAAAATAEARSRKRRRESIGTSDRECDTSRSAKDTGNATILRSAMCQRQTAEQTG